jgi:MSHA biogenesis protein MshN
LGLHPEHLQARQALVGLLVQDRKLEEAERLLEEGVKLTPGQIGFNTTLARLQADRGDNERAIATLQAGLEHAQGSAEYAAFLAALLQRQGRHEEAIAQFQTALRIRPSWGVWWLGLAMSLQATGRPTAASDAYRQARAAGNLHPELAALAEQRLQQLR